MKQIIVFMMFSFSLLFADQWDGFFKETGFPRKVIDDGSVVKGKIYQAKVSYQISNNDGIKGNFQNSDSAKITITDEKGKVLSTKKFMTEVELRSWAKDNFLEIFTSIVGENPDFSKEKLKEISRLASIVLLNKNLE